MEIQTLSSFPGVPFNDTVESFFDAYKTNEDIECYQLVFSPYNDDKTSFEDLYNLNFQSRVVILNVVDFIIDLSDNLAIEELEQFCAAHPEQNFIIFNFNLNFQSQVNIPNLYWDTIFSATPVDKLERCVKKDITNKWLSLNADTKVHKVMTVCYLLSKEYYDNGYVTFNMKVPTLVKFDQYRNITKIPTYQLRSDFAKGYAKFKSKTFNHLKIRNFDHETDRVASNYNINLLPVYEEVGVEIINGTMFFEKTPGLSEKEVQSVYAKNFAIYINGVGMAREIKKLFDIDIFEDIVDHSYDEIENHFERLTAAIDRNEHLLDGSTNIKELWYDNQKRFDENCDKIDAALFDEKYQKIVNHQKIKKALTYFDISCTKK